MVKAPRSLRNSGCLSFRLRSPLLAFLLGQESGRPSGLMKASAFGQAPQRKKVQAGQRVTVSSTEDDRPISLASFASFSNSRQTTSATGGASRTKSMGAVERGSDRQEIDVMARASTLGIRRAPRSTSPPRTTYSSPSSASSYRPRSSYSEPDSPDSPEYYIPPPPSLPPRPTSTDSRPRAQPSPRPQPASPSSFPSSSTSKPALPPRPPTPKTSLPAKASTSTSHEPPLSPAPLTNTVSRSASSGAAATPPKPAPTTSASSESTSGTSASTSSSTAKSTSLFGSLWGKAAQVWNGAPTDEETPAPKKPASELSETAITPFIVSPEVLETRKKLEAEEAARHVPEQSSILNSRPIALASAQAAHALSSDTKAGPESKPPVPSRPSVPAVEPITWHRPPPLHPRDPFPPRGPRLAPDARSPFNWLNPADNSPLDPFLFHRAPGRAVTRRGRGGRSISRSQRNGTGFTVPPLPNSFAPNVFPSPPNPPAALVPAAMVPICSFPPTQLPISTTPANHPPQPFHPQAIAYGAHPPQPPSLYPMAPPQNRTLPPLHPAALPPASLPFHQPSFPFSPPLPISTAPFASSPIMARGPPPANAPPSSNAPQSMGIPPLIRTLPPGLPPVPSFYSGPVQAAYSQAPVTQSGPTTIAPTPWSGSAPLTAPWIGANQISFPPPVLGVVAGSLLPPPRTTSLQNAPTLASTSQPLFVPPNAPPSTQTPPLSHSSSISATIPIIATSTAPKSDLLPTANSMTSTPTHILAHPPPPAYPSSSRAVAPIIQGPAEYGGFPLTPMAAAALVALDIKSETTAESPPILVEKKLPSSPSEDNVQASSSDNKEATLSPSEEASDDSPSMMLTPPTPDSSLPRPLVAEDYSEEEKAVSEGLGEEDETETVKDSDEDDEEETKASEVAEDVEEEEESEEGVDEAPQLDLPLRIDLGWSLPDFGFGGFSDDDKPSDFFSMLGGHSEMAIFQPAEDGQLPLPEPTFDPTLEDLEEDDYYEEQDEEDVAEAAAEIEASFDETTTFVREFDSPRATPPVIEDSRMSSWLSDQNFATTSSSSSTFAALPLDNEVTPIPAPVDESTPSEPEEVLPDPGLLGPTVYRPRTAPLRTLYSSRPDTSTTSLPPSPRLHARSVSLSELNLDSTNSGEDGPPSPTTAVVEAIDALSRPRAVSVTERSVVFGGSIHLLEEEKEAAKVEPSSVLKPKPPSPPTISSPPLLTLSIGVDETQKQKELKERALSALSNNAFATSSFNLNLTPLPINTKEEPKEPLFGEDLFANW